MKAVRKPQLAAELIAIYILLPSALILWRDPLRGWFIPILLIVAGLTFWQLRRDPTFSRDEWFNRAKIRGIWGRLIIGGLSLIYLLATQWPELVFELPRTRPIVWLMACLLYPLVSVYPQEMLYRAFFFHRYRPLFRNQHLMIWVNALLFGYLHLIFGNPVAVLLTIGGGWVFARTYLQTRSVLAVSIEHALWGIYIFTVGYSHFFLGATLPAP